MREVVAGGDFVVARRGTTEILSWGRNVSGQLGNGNTTNQGRPVRVLNAQTQHTGATDVALGAGGRHAFIIRGSTDFWAWGNNAVGHLGTGMPSANPATRPVIGRLTSF